MVAKQICLIIITTYSKILFCQESLDKIYVGFGYSSIPLHIERTNVTRWMLYPTLEGSYRISPQLLVEATYLGSDVYLNNNDPEELSKYLEIPHLTSYNEAIKYIGKRFALPVFDNYCFAGIQYEYLRKRSFKLQVGAQVGFRFGEYFVLASAVENPSKPNGSDLHLKLKSSNSPGFRFSITPKFVLGDFISLDIPIGFFTFFNWPVIQPFGSFQIVLSF